VKRALLAALRFYKAHISPGLPAACRYTPTCSEYAVEAIERYGPWRGSVMAIRRVLSCNPFARGGYVPVPQRVARS
jgi:putative membrane protein insertion efficiency factor